MAEQLWRHDLGNFFVKFVRKIFMQAETEEIYSGTIEKPDKLTAIKLAINCSKYIHELRNDWDENKKNIIKETVDFIDAVYGQPDKFQVHSILDKAIIVYGRREQPEDTYIYLLYVSLKERGKHYGSQLLNYVIDNAESSSVIGLSVDKNNEKAIKFYESNGFKIEKSDSDIAYEMAYLKPTPRLKTWNIPELFTIAENLLLLVPLFVLPLLTSKACRLLDFSF